MAVEQVIFSMPALIVQGFPCGGINLGEIFGTCMLCMQNFGFASNSARICVHEHWWDKNYNVSRVPVAKSTAKMEIFLHICSAGQCICLKSCQIH